jgi:hypothetical protein
MLYMEEAVYHAANNFLNPPTSWYWNIRIGDKVQIASTGISYTVVGPMNVVNPELFVNVGPPGTTPPIQRLAPNLTTTYNPEILFLVNGQDDNVDGLVDNGFDGVDNDGDGVVDEVSSGLIAFPGEWVEPEKWQSSVLSLGTSQLLATATTFDLAVRDLAYSITRRPVVVPQARETVLPSNVVVDLTTSLPIQTPSGSLPAALERSRLPVDPTTGNVDIMLNPNGTVMPTTVYSNTSSFGMSSSFFHFWLADRIDLYEPAFPGGLVNQNPGVPYQLPMVVQPGNGFPSPNDLYGSTRQLKGERLLVTLFTRTGALTTNQIESFDGSGNGTTVPPNNHSVNLPFLLPQQGVRGDTR